MSNEALMLAEACKHGWLENTDPDKCGLDDLLALLRQQAERIAELESRVHTCGPTCSKAGCINRRITAERDQLRSELLEQARIIGMGAEREISLVAERDQMSKAICNFCAEASWSVDTWKNQAHIKPLFDIAARTHRDTP